MKVRISRLSPYQNFRELHRFTVLELAMACMAQLSRGKTITPDFWSALLSLSPSDYDGLLPDYLDNIYTRVRV